MRKNIIRLMFQRPLVLAAFALAACGTSAGRGADSAVSNDASGGSTRALVASAPPVALRGAPASVVLAVPEARSRTADATISATTTDPQTEQPFASSLPSTAVSGAMLVRQGQASIEVRRMDDAVTEARATAARFGGFVASTSVRSGREEQRVASLELRVPTDQFDGLLAVLGAFGKVESVNASAQDVGEEFVDMSARAANARRVEARLVEMLASRTGKLSDVLTVENELARVREQIERYDARVRWLEKRSALSTLQLTLHEPGGLMDQPRPGVLVEALRLAGDRTLTVLAWCIASLGVIVPLGLLAMLAVSLVRRVRRGAYFGAA